MKKVIVFSVLFFVLVSVFVAASWTDIFTGKLFGIPTTQASNANNPLGSPVCQFVDPRSPRFGRSPMDGFGITLQAACTKIGASYTPVAMIVERGNALYSKPQCSGDLISVTHEYQTTQIYGNDAQWSNNTGDFVRDAQGKLISIPMGQTLLGQPLGGTSFPSCSTGGNLSSQTTQMEGGVWCCKRE